MNNKKIWEAIITLSVIIGCIVVGAIQYTSSQKVQQLIKTGNSSDWEQWSITSSIVIILSIIIVGIIGIVAVLLLKKL